MIKLPGGSVWLDAGERCPFQCPHCKDFIEWKDVKEIKCEACGHFGTVDQFSMVGFEYARPTVH